jgi:hypothetical protein
MVEDLVVKVGVAYRTDRGEKLCNRIYYHRVVKKSIVENGLK